MDSLDGSAAVAVDNPARKKRSSISRRPRPDSQTLFHSYTFDPLFTQSIGSDSYEENSNSSNVVTGSDGLGAENKLKVKLKLGGVTRRLHTKSPADYAYSHAVQPPVRAPFQEGKDRSLFHKANSSRVRLKDVSTTGSNFLKGHSWGGRTSEESVSINDPYQYEPVRKSKRVPKRRLLDVSFDDVDDGAGDEEIRYLGRLNASRVGVNYAKYERNEREEKIYDEGYMEEPISDGVPVYKRKKLYKGPHELFEEGNESIPTTRNRALQSGKDILSGSSASLVDFPNGLPPGPFKKQKEKLSEVEQQLKKAEAAQRRRMQSEKAAREAEAEAIRKILGQDSGRKKREEKMKKQRDELAQEKATKSEVLASNTIRWVLGPTGTVVIFSDDVGLPNIFNSVPCSYPPPREKCAGPNCTNAYKYRDSKLKLPLCSLGCYRAIHQKQPLMAC